MPTANNSAFYGYGYYRTLIGSPVLEVELVGQSGRIYTVIRSGSDLEAIADAASEAFARWRHYSQGRIDTLSACTVCPRRTVVGGGTYRFAGLRGDRLTTVVQYNTIFVYFELTKRSSTRETQYKNVEYRRW